MRKLFGMMLIILPVMILSFWFLHDRYYQEYQQTSAKRLFAFGLTILVLYGWIVYDVVSNKKKSFILSLIQSSFYVYVFMVLTLTGYFILFKEVSSHNWWEKLQMRVDQRDHVNLVVFQIFKIYKPLDKQVLGNLIMLLPLGIYLPVLYKRLSGFPAVFIVSLLVSITIEFLQLATSYRSADIDDVILNTVGACAGYVIYRIIRAVFGRENS